MDFLVFFAVQPFCSQEEKEFVYAWKEELEDHTDGYSTYKSTGFMNLTSKVGLLLVLNRKTNLLFFYLIP